MRVEFTTQQEAQTFADAIHQRMIASDTAYADSVKAGHTLRWAIPYRDVDANEKPVGNWWVNLKARTDKVLSSGERTSLKPYARSDGRQG